MKKRLQFYFGNRITLALMTMYLAIVLLVAYAACTVVFLAAAAALAVALVARELGREG